MSTSQNNTAAKIARVTEYTIEVTVERYVIVNIEKRMVPTLATGRQMKDLVEDALILYYEASTEARNHDATATLPSVDALVNTFSMVQDFMEGHNFLGHFPEGFFNEVAGFKSKWNDGVTVRMVEFISKMNVVFNFDERYTRAIKDMRNDCFMAFMIGMAESKTSKYL